MINTIYILKNKINNKIYIGQTWKTLKNRFNSGHGYSKCCHIGNAIKKYGKNQFYYETLVFCSTQKIADYWETYFITKYNSADKKIGYNLKSGGSNGRHSDESKKKNSDAHKGKKSSLETLKRMSASMLGKNTAPKSKETKKKMSLAKIGKQSYRKGKHTHPKINEILQSYISKVPISKIISTYSCSSNTLYKILKTNNIARRNKENK